MKRCLVVVVLAVFWVVAFTDVSLASETIDMKQVVQSENLVFRDENMLVFEKTTELNKNTLMRSMVATDDTDFVKDIVVIDKKSVSVDNFVDAILPEITLRSSGNGSQYMEDWDASGDLKAFTRVYYKIREKDGIEYISLTKVGGGYTKASGSVRVIRQELNCGCEGFFEGGYAADQHTSYKISSKTWSKKMPIQWRPVAMVSGTLVGANYRLTLKRGSGEWTVEVVNNVVD